VIGTQHTIDDFDECAFARTVLTKQRMNFPRLNVKINSLVSATTGEGLVDALELQKRRVRQRVRPVLIQGRACVTATSLQKGRPMQSRRALFLAARRDRLGSPVVCSLFR